MAHLLMIESWVGGTGRLFPPAITRLGHRYTFVTRNKAHYLGTADAAIHPVLAQAEHVLSCETNDVPALIEFLRAQHAVLAFDGVVTICDYYVGTVAEVAQALGLPQPFSANTVLERRKDRVREALAGAGLPNPRFAAVPGVTAACAAAREIGYPLVLKPTDLASSAFVRLVHDEAELRSACAALEAFTHNFRGQPRSPLLLLEEYLHGEEVSVEACTFAGETTVIGITDKSLTGHPFFVEDGHMFPAPLAPATAAAVAEFVRAALRAVGHDHGISHTEVKLTPQGLRVVEINPRPGGNYIVELVARVTGIDLLLAQIELALGRAPDLTPRHTGVTSAAVMFAIAPRAGTLLALEGTGCAAASPGVVQAHFDTAAAREVAAPIDNACYLGHVIATDAEGAGARACAQAALAQLRFRYREEATAGVSA